ncbi:hypothetical protein LX36DRAFT_662713 [Colletotrichum falcatum]|nr:hypothetical protein LX36DRAFT_662713 [Colletotrichum falcatum]
MNQSPKSKAVPEGDSIMASIENARKTCRVLSDGLISMNVAELVGKAKSLTDWFQVMEYSDMIDDMGARATAARGDIQDVRKTTQDGPTIELLGEIEQGLDALLKRVKASRACLDEWVKAMKKGTSDKKKPAAPAA